MPVQQLSFKSAIPSKKRDGVVVTFEYIQWLTKERGINSSTEGVVIRSLTQVRLSPSCCQTEIHSQSCVGAISCCTHVCTLHRLDLIPPPLPLPQLCLLSVSIGLHFGNNVVRLSLYLSLWLQMAKFVYHKGSSSQPSEGDKAYGDLLVIKELRKLQNSNRKASK